MLYGNHYNHYKFAFVSQVNSVWQNETDCGSIRMCQCTENGTQCSISCPPTLCNEYEIPIQDEEGCCHCQSITTTTAPLRMLSLRITTLISGSRIKNKYIYIYIYLCILRKLAKFLDFMILVKMKNYHGTYWLIPVCACLEN